MALDLVRVARLAPGHRPQPRGRAHHRHRLAEQIDVEAFALD
jgi:hypothetical protein